VGLRGRLIFLVPIDPNRKCLQFPFALSLSKGMKTGFDKLSLNGGIQTSSARINKLCTGRRQRIAI